MTLRKAQSRLKAAPVGRPLAISRAVIHDLALTDQFRRIGGQQTPQTVSAIIREADAGNVARFVDLANECR